MEKIGLIADAHSHGPGAADLPAEVLEAFEGCDLVLPLGDMGEAAVLDRLGTCGPVQGVLGGDDAHGDPRLARGTRCFRLGGVVVGAVFSLEKAASGVAVQPALQLPQTGAAKLLEGVFGERVDVVAYGGTHRSAVDEQQGILFVNPGSPTLSDAPSVAILEIGDGRPRARILPIPRRSGAG